MSWKCPICDSYNEDAAAECLVCGQKRPAAMSAGSPDKAAPAKKRGRPKKNWKCAYCDSYNDGEAEACLICGKPRNAPAPKKKPGRPAKPVKEKTVKAEKPVKTEKPVKKAEAKPAPVEKAKPEPEEIHKTVKSRKKSGISGIGKIDLTDGIRKTSPSPAEPEFLSKTPEPKPKPKPAPAPKPKPAPPPEPEPGPAGDAPYDETEDEKTYTDAAETLYKILFGLSAVVAILLFVTRCFSGGPFHALAGIFGNLKIILIQIWGNFREMISALPFF